LLLAFLGKCVPILISFPSHSEIVVENCRLFSFPPETVDRAVEWPRRHCAEIVGAR